MKISILIPIFNEEQSITPLIDEVLSVLNSLEYDFEVICVDDGSTDKSKIFLTEKAEDNSHIKLICLTRNFGQTAAIMAAIDHSSGDILIPMDGDMQNDPADIIRLIEKINDGFDVVSGWRKNRKDNKLLRLLPSKVANWIISKISGIELHDYGCTLKAYKKEVLKDVKLYGEMHRFIPIHAFFEGATITEIPVNHRVRKYGESKYGLSRVIRVTLDILLVRFLQKAFDRPIQFFGKIGIYSILIAFICGCYALFLKLYSDTSFIQTPLPLLTVFLTLSGLIFILLGLIAEIQIRVYFESQLKKTYKVISKKNIS